jgi:hypothetical protein
MTWSKPARTPSTAARAIHPAHPGRDTHPPERPSRSSVAEHGARRGPRCCVPCVP